MSDLPGSLNAAPLLRSSAIFRELSNDQLGEIWSRAKIHNLLRGEVLVRQNTPSDSVYLVVSGRFEVLVEGRKEAINEVGVGEPIGEIGFFSGGPRTATIVAVRDSVVLELNRDAFESVARQVPAIYQTLLRAVARRLADSSTRAAAEERNGAARTVAVIAGGRNSIPPAFFERLDTVVGRRGRGLVLTQRFISDVFPGLALDDPKVSSYLNTIEHEFELITYLTDPALTEWTRKAIRQADQVLIVVSGSDSETLNPVEGFAFEVHPPPRRRLVRLHAERTGFVEGTAAWLRNRDVIMHHHVSLQDDLDFQSLHRFLTGRALGFVAAGGGGFGPSHIGIYKAFAERGITFDILGGTSVGAAVLGGFALGMSPEEVDLGTHNVFVESRGFKQYTIPRYALLDHIGFDEALKREYKGVSIEDAWVPFFAVATILDGAGQGPFLIRRGPIWRAVRASGSLPAVLPPVFTEEGHMLVDGGVVDNIPLRPMKSLKTGPNLVVHFGVAESVRFPVDYGSIPGRWRLLRHMLTPGGRKKLPSLPGPIGVLRRCLVMNQTPNLLPVGPRDLILTVPAFPGSNFLDFDRHFEVFEAAYKWGRQQIDELQAAGDSAVEAIFAAKSDQRDVRSP